MFFVSHPSFIHAPQEQPAWSTFCRDAFYGLEVDMDRDRLIATNMNSVPEADGSAGVLVLKIPTGKEIFYWDGTQIAKNLTPNDTPSTHLHP